MPGNLTNKPRILHGAFVEFGLSLPPLFVVFQYNPEELSRSRSLSYQWENNPASTVAAKGGAPAQADAPRSPEEFFRSLCNDTQEGLREKRRKEKDLQEIQKKQVVTVSEESLRFDIRLDATDKLNEGDPITGQFGILPQLSTLDLMVLPKSESLLGELLGDLLGGGGGFSFTKSPNPPLVLFILGRTRVLPVNINSISVRETEFNTELAPIRATVSVDLTVIEGKNPVSTFSKAATEVTAALNLANIADIANVVIPA